MVSWIGKRAALVLALVLCGGVPRASGQIFLGRIDVIVKDTTGRALPGVKVTISAPYDAVRDSDDGGEAHFFNLPPPVVCDHRNADRIRDDDDCRRPGGGRRGDDRCRDDAAARQSPGSDAAGGIRHGRRRACDDHDEAEAAAVPGHSPFARPLDLAADRGDRLHGSRQRRLGGVRAPVAVHREGCTAQRQRVVARRRTGDGHGQPPARRRSSTTSTVPPNLP